MHMMRQLEDVLTPCFVEYIEKEHMYLAKPNLVFIKKFHGPTDQCACMRI